MTGVVYSRSIGRGTKKGGGVGEKMICEKVCFEVAVGTAVVVLLLSCPLTIYTRESDA